MKIKSFCAVVGMGILLLVLLLSVKPTVAASDKPVELRTVSAWPTHTMITHWYHEYVKEVNERAKKAGLPLTLKNLGGPEIIGTMQQFAGMRSGTVDMVFTCGDYFAGETVELSAPGCVRPDPLLFLAALRETKYMDVLREACREKSGCIPLFTNQYGTRVYAPEHQADQTGQLVWTHNTDKRGACPYEPDPNLAGNVERTGA